MKTTGTFARPEDAIESFWRYIFGEIAKRLLRHSRLKDNNSSVCPRRLWVLGREGDLPYQVMFLSNPEGSYTRSPDELRHRRRKYE